MAHYFTERWVQDGQSPVLLLTVNTQRVADGHVAQECRRELLQLVPTSDVVIDLQRAPITRSPVISGLLGVRNAAQAIGRRMCLFNVGERTMELLTLGNLDKVLLVAESEEEAMEAVRSKTEK